MFAIASSAREHGQGKLGLKPIPCLKTKGIYMERCNHFQFAAFWL